MLPLIVELTTFSVMPERPLMPPPPTAVLPLSVDPLMLTVLLPVRNTPPPPSAVLLLIVEFTIEVLPSL